jgi:sec-independent protein translocase protein TatC
MAITPTPLDEPEARSGQPMSFVGHLEALRWHIIRSALAIVIAMVGVFVFLEEFMRYVVLGPMQPDFPTNRLACYLDESLCASAPIMQVTLQATSPTEQFGKAISIGIAGGLVIAFPYVVWELWRFLKPGLQEKEVRVARGAVGVVSFLFFLGVSFTYFVILPLTLRFLAGFQIMEGVQNNWRIGELVSLVTVFCIAGGLLFQLPVLTWILAQLGILRPKIMRKYRRHAIVVILIAAGLLTPSPDAMSQLLLALPIVVLYEVSIVIAARIHKRKEAAHRAFMSDTP